MSRIKTMKLSYCPSVWSPKQLCLDIPIPHRTTTFSDVLDTAVKLLPASVPDDGYSEIDVFASEVDKSDWVITEAWNGLERRVDWTESPAHLQYKWGQYLSQVQFILRPKNQPKPPRRKRTRKRNCSLYRGVKNELWEIRLAEKQLLQFKELKHLVTVYRKLGQVDSQLKIAEKDLQAARMELAEEKEVERLREKAQFMKKEAEAKNELNSMQKDKMAEQKAVLSDKLKEVAELELQISELEFVKKQKKEIGLGPPNSGNSLSPDVGGSTQSMRSSICDDGSYLSESLEGKRHFGYHTPPLWTRTQSASVVLEGRVSPHSGYGSLRRTPLSSKRRAEMAALSRRNSEEGLVLKLVESKRRASIETGTILKIGPSEVAKKLDYEDNPSGSVRENDKGVQSNLKKTTIQILLNQDMGQSKEEERVVSPTIDHSRMESDPSSTSEEGQTSLKGILKCRKSSFSIPADEGGTRTGRKIKFNDVAVLFSAAVEGEFQLFVDTCRKLGSLDWASYQGVSVLHYAVCSGSINMVRYIVSHGFNVNKADNDGWTALHCAASCCNLEVLRYLVHNGSSLFMKTSNDLTPLRVCFEEFEDSSEEDKSSASECLDYLLFAQQELGNTNNGIVYALFEYDPREEDNTVDEETSLPYLKLKENEKLKIVGKGGDQEREEELWWIAETKERNRGLVPCTLLGSYPKCVTEKV